MPHPLGDEAYVSLVSFRRDGREVPTAVWIAPDGEDLVVYTNAKSGKVKRIPMNIDGATAVIYAELGFPAPLARGLFCLSRSVGILAHAWEQSQQGGRNKGPIPRQYIWTYDGPPKRPVPRWS